MEGTREAVLQLIREWIVSGSRDLPVCWLSGAAGVGKSAIALTIAEECEKKGLVASFFFFRLDPKRDNPSSLILSIAHGLTLKRPHLGPLLDWAVRADPGILEARLEDQYKELILEFLSLPSPPNSPSLVIIDGLDECKKSDMQCRVLSIIFSTYRQSFHSPLQFLICSRPESWIREYFESHEPCSVTRHIKLDNSFLPQYDIELYFIQKFKEIHNDTKYSAVEFSDPWPSLQVIWLLVSKADGQFIYASTVIKFIQTEYTLPTEQLDIILKAISNKLPHSLTPSPFHDLDELYHIIL
ncbi:hypothetical protein L218DRAFT_1058786, partial [Marasmius fiardii PR-910]